MAATEPAEQTACDVSWYGSGRRDIEVVTATGNWYHSGEGLVPLRWVFVRDRTGTHRDDYLFSTDPGNGRSSGGRDVHRSLVD